MQMGEEITKLKNLKEKLKNKYLKNDLNDKIKYLIDELDKIIEPKEEKLIFQDLIEIKNIYFEIKEDKYLYELGLKKYKNKLNAMELLFKEELNIIKLSELINEGIISCDELTIEINNKIDVDILIYLNYLYSIIVNSLVKDKKIKILLIKKEQKILVK